MDWPLPDGKWYVRARPLCAFDVWAMSISHVTHRHRIMYALSGSQSQHWYRLHAMSSSIAIWTLHLRFFISTQSPHNTQHTCGVHHSFLFSFSFSQSIWCNYCYYYRAHRMSREKVSNYERRTKRSLMKKGKKRIHGTFIICRWINLHSMADRGATWNERICGESLCFI